MSEHAPIEAGALPRARLAAVADRLLSPVVILAVDGTLEYVNPAAATVLRQEPDWLLGRNVTELLHPADRGRVLRALRDVSIGRPSSRSTTIRLRAQPAFAWQVIEATADNFLKDLDIAGILVSMRDVTEQLAQQRALTQTALRDELTGLPNRAAINRELDHLLAGESELAVGFMRIDGFALVSDSLGPSAGDALIRAVAKRVRSVLPKAVITGRFEGDGLVLVFRDLAASEARDLAWRAIERVREPMFVAGHELRLSLSVGIAHRNGADSAEGLLRDAGLALRHAKSIGGGRVELFETRLRQEAIARFELEADLRRAVRDGELALALQPIVRLADGEQVAWEALLRWRHRGADIEPTEFIPVAEQSGLIVPIGQWVIDEAARLASRDPGRPISVNLSAGQLAAPGLPESIARAVAAHQVPPNGLAFEVTETLLIENFEYAVGVLSAIRQLGFRIGLDDFGTGYSSLSYLRRLPIDFLKIDRSLIVDVDADAEARSIVGAVIAMASALHLEVVAEGIERPAQALALKELGASHAQGYLFGAATVPESEDLPPRE